MPVASSDLTLKRGDTGPAFRAQCLDGTTPVPLTGATANLLMKRYNGPLVTLPLTIESGNDGYVRRAWSTSDLAVVGTYRAEVEVVFPDGTRQTFPADGYRTIVVVDDLD